MNNLEVKEKVKLEFTELKEKNKRLKNFLEGESFKALSTEHQSLLIEQDKIQESYLKVLDLRIQLFEKENG